MLGVQFNVVNVAEAGLEQDEQKTLERISSSFSKFSYSLVGSYSW